MDFALLFYRSRDSALGRNILLLFISFFLNRVGPSFKIYIFQKDRQCLQDNKVLDTS